MDELLFSNGELRLALEHQAKLVRDAVEAVPEEHLIQADVDEWVAALVDEFRAEAPELHVDQIYRDPPQDAKVDVSWHQKSVLQPDNDRPPHRRLSIVVRIPFTGDEAVFGLRPNTFTYNPPRGSVAVEELTLTIEYPHDSPPNIDGQVNEFVGTVQQWLGWARTEIESFNKSLEQAARNAITAGKSRIEQRDAHLATSSIPERRRGTSKTYIPDAIVRRPAPKLPKARANAAAGVQLEPVLEDGIFEHVLFVVRMQGREMERAPKTYEQLDEEARRDLFLATLNTHYEGRGSAEAFNAGGKTDILIRYEDRNLFIAECKVWKGVKGFSEAVDQLFRYASWRDTKLALVVFVPEKGLTAIIEKAREALEAHPRFVSSENADGETELRAIVSWPGDARRHADLNVFFVHTPA